MKHDLRPIVRLFLLRMVGFVLRHGRRSFAHPFETRHHPASAGPAPAGQAPSVGNSARGRHPSRRGRSVPPIHDPLRWVPRPEVPAGLVPSLHLQYDAGPRILLIRPDHLGDVLLTRPAIDALIRALPAASLTVAVGPWGRPALGPRPAHRLLICPFPSFSRAPMHPLHRYWLLLHYARLLRREHYTMAIIARHDHWWGALLAALAGIPIRIGYDLPETKPFLTLSIPLMPAKQLVNIILTNHDPHAGPPFGGAPGRGRSRPSHPRPTEVGTPAGGPPEMRSHPAAAGPVPPIHDPLRWVPRPEALTTRHAASDALALAEVAARWLGRDLGEDTFPSLPADAGPAERAVVDRLLVEAGGGEAPLVVLQPGAGSPLKAWPAERLAAVGAALAQDLGACVVVSGSATERALAQQICDALPDGAINLAGSLKWTELEALLARSQVVVGVDSGPLHLAVAASTSSVALFGPADPGQFGPWGDAAHHRIVTADLTCRPCRRLDWCALEPEGIGPPPCMRAITVEAVVDAARASLAEGKHGSETTD